MKIAGSSAKFVTLLRNLGPRGGGLLLHVGVVRIELQSSIISAHGVARSARAHEAVADSAKAKRAAELFAIRVRSESRRAFVSFECVVVTLKSKIRPAQKVLHLKTFRVYFAGALENTLGFRVSLVHRHHAAQQKQC